MNTTATTRRPLAAILIALALTLTTLVLAACGSDGDTSASPEPVGNGIDVAFVEDMVPHHQSAVEMAEIARERGQSAFVKTLADDIIKAQNSEITVMNTAQDDLEGVRKGTLGVPAHQMGMDTDTAMLRTADPFDKAFIDMMVPHHQGAIRMARAEQAKGRSPTLKKLAGEIVSAQAREIRAMNGHREERFGAPSPAGGVPGSSPGDTMEAEGHDG